MQLDGFYRTLGERIWEHAGLRAILFTAHENARALLNLDAGPLTVAARTPKMRQWKLRSGALDAQLYRWDIPVASS
jgi:hypothetical protein